MVNLTVDQVIEKLNNYWKIDISHFINKYKELPVYYEWDKSRQPKWNKERSKPIIPYYSINFDNKKNLWTASFIYGNLGANTITIDDKTGEVKNASIA